ncbi:MAG: FxsA family protein [Pseudomonadales bacterium]|nr:FxsA family protein [Pseudomonadales bacterium]
MRIPFLLFVAVPLLEMWLLIEVGGVIGGLPTVGLVVLTAFIGINLIRMQGMQTLQRFQSRAADGQLPAQEIVEGMMLAAAGALLLTPGFVTDSIGFALLVPGIRRWLFGKVGNRMATMGGASQQGFQSGGFENNTFEAEFYTEQAERSHPHGHQGNSAHNTLEGEFHEEQSEDRDKR